MNTPPNRPPPQQAPGLLGSLIAAALKIICMLLLSLLASIAMEYIGLIWFWPEQGWHHSYTMLEDELAWLSEHFRASLLVERPGQVVIRMLQSLDEWLIQRTGLARLDANTVSLSQRSTAWAWIAEAYVLGKDCLLAAVYTTFTFVVRLAVLTFTTPLFLLAAFTGLVDGLTRRDLRKFGAGRESSFIYHRAKRAIAPLMVLPWMLYLSLPITLNPVWILLPCAGLLGVMVAITASTFKKYL